MKKHNSISGRKRGKAGNVIRLLHLFSMERVSITKRVENVGIWYMETGIYKLSFGKSEAGEAPSR